MPHVVNASADPRSEPEFRAALRLAGAFAAAKLLLQFALTLWTVHIGYSYFRDEFYYIACGRHLAWGYVDHGPIVALQARLGEVLFGDSVFALRVLSALAGAVMVGLGGLLSWALGGRRSAQALAMLGLLCCPQFIGTDGFLSMNSFEPVFWTLCVLALVLIQKGRSKLWWWSVFGVSAGVGLLNKPSMTFFLLALGFGLLCTPERRLLFTRYAALGIALLLVIALPNVIWQATHHWPTLEFLRNGSRLGKNVVTPFFPFLLTQILDLQPVNALLWVAGLVAFLRAGSLRDTETPLAVRALRNVRWLGITYLAFFALMFALHAKDYYLAAIYPSLFAAGGVAWEHSRLNSPRVREQRVFAFPVFAAVLIVTTLMTLPMASPVLRPEAWLRYTRALKLSHPEQESLDTSLLPQFFADRFGWQQEVDLVTSAYSALSPEDKAHACVFASNYGEAGALELLAPLQNKPLPPVISGQNNYWFWGLKGCTGEVVIALVHDKREALLKKYEHVDIVGRMSDPWSMPFEQHNVFLLRGRHASAPVNWNDEKFFY